MSIALQAVEPKRKGKRKLLPVRSRVTFEDALLIADRCFGERGRETVFLWKQYNRDYFSGMLKPTPVLYVPTSEYGRWVGCFREGHNIYLMHENPVLRPWPYVRGVLLHEMLHQHLSETGQWKPDGKSCHIGPWCEEIMRLSKMLGRDIWAGAYTVGKVNGRSVRMNKRNPDASSKAYALDQMQIAMWPHLRYSKKPDAVDIEPPGLR